MSKTRTALRLVNPLAAPINTVKNGWAILKIAPDAFNQARSVISDVHAQAKAARKNMKAVNLQGERDARTAQSEARAARDRFQALAARQGWDAEDLARILRNQRRGQLAHLAMLLFITAGVVLLGSKGMVWTMLLTCLVYPAALTYYFLQALLVTQVEQRAMIGAVQFFSRRDFFTRLVNPWHRTAYAVGAGEKQ